MIAAEPSSTTEATIEAASEWRAGWRVLLSAAVGVGVGIPAVINTAGLFVVPMQQEFGWSRSALAIGPMVGLISSFLSPLGGWLIDRYGARSLALAGLSLLCVEILLFAFVPVDAGAFYALVIAVGLTGIITNNIVYCKAVATWFHQRAGTAIALMLSGVSIIGAILQPVLARIIAVHGWRTAYAAMALVILLAGLPLLWQWFRENPQHVMLRQQAPEAVAGASVSEAVRDRRFWLILAAFAGAAFPIGGFVNQLQPVLVSQGHVPTAAAVLGSVFLIATGTGRIIAGVLFDHYRPAWVASAFLLLSAVGALMLALASEMGLSWGSVAVAVALLGLAQGAEADFIALFTLRSFGLRSFSTLVAIVFTVSGIGFALGGLMFTFVFDRSSGYEGAIFASAAILLLTAMIAATIEIPTPASPSKTAARKAPRKRRQ